MTFYLKLGRMVTLIIKTDFCFLRISSSPFITRIGKLTAIILMTRFGTGVSASFLPHIRPNSFIDIKLKNY